MVATAAGLKRLKSLHAAHGGHMKIIDGISVGTRDRIVLLEVERQRAAHCGDHVGEVDGFVLGLTLQPRELEQALDQVFHAYDRIDDQRAQLARLVIERLARHLLQVLVARERLLRIQQDALTAHQDYYWDVAALEAEVGAEIWPDEHHEHEDDAGDHHEE